MSERRFRDHAIDWYIRNDYLPPTEAECPQDRDMQAEWLEAQVGRLPLTDKERHKMVAELGQAWDFLQINPKKIRDWIDSEVGR